MRFKQSKKISGKIKKGGLENPPEDRRNSAAFNGWRLNFSYSY
jgi:hypothetical protein